MDRIEKKRYKQLGMPIPRYTFTEKLTIAFQCIVFFSMFGFMIYFPWFYIFLKFSSRFVGALIAIPTFGFLLWLACKYIEPWLKKISKRLEAKKISRYEDELAFYHFKQDRLNKK